MRQLLQPVRLIFIGMHLLAFAIPFTVSVTAGSAILGVSLYFVRMFGITGGYHRYFSHKSYKTSRFMEGVLAWLGCAAMQKGPLHWAGNHRLHHRYSDTEDDIHSPVWKGAWHAHIGWLFEPDKYEPIKAITDFARNPFLRFLDYAHWLPGVLLAILCYAFDGWSGVAYGFVVSTIALYHGTFLINSACHIFGTKRYDTGDQSRNLFVAAILTLGEGWHNNHHHYQSAARQGFFWWEVDITYYILKAMGWLGLVWDIREVPPDKLINERPLVLETVT